jgi:adenylate cyclase
MRRKLTVILFADVHGYCRLMSHDEEATLQRLTAYRKIVGSLIHRCHGEFVDFAGDSMLAEFTSAVEAVNCAVEVQTALRAENMMLPADHRMELRIGLHLGDVMTEGQQIW